MSRSYCTLRPCVRHDIRFALTTEHAPRDAQRGFRCTPVWARRDADRAAGYRGGGVERADRHSQHPRPMAKKVTPSVGPMELSTTGATSASFVSYPSRVTRSRSDVISPLLSPPTMRDLCPAGSTAVRHHMFIYRGFVRGAR